MLIRSKPREKAPQEANAKSPAQIERHELKYIIRPEEVAPIRNYLMNWCEPDPYAVGNPPEYITTTLQVDNPRLDLCMAKENKSLNRFKLRIRTYGLEGNAPVFFEIKRKINNVIVKSRARMLFKDFVPEAIVDPKYAVKLLSPSENIYYLEFLRLMKEIGCRPVVLIRYWRESYFSVNDAYARISFDRKLQYRSTRDYNFHFNSRGWHTMDTPTAFRGMPTGIVLELKTDGNMPSWMAEMIERFRLTRTGFCKYGTAVRLESLFMGYSYSDTSENTTWD